MTKIRFERLKLALQLAGTILILSAGAGNAVKTIAFLILWTLTFVPFAFYEIVLFFIACLFFSAMNIAALKHGIFFFHHPDFVGMPLWEFFMYGFYLLHTMRMLKGPVPQTNRAKAWGLAILFAAAFGGIASQKLLTTVTFGLLFLGIYWFHERFDFIYTCYFIFLGVLIEYSGVLSGQWAYPGNPPSGVPLWFITMWGGIGLLLRRLILPVLPFTNRNLGG